MAGCYRYRRGVRSYVQCGCNVLVITSSHRLWEEVICVVRLTSEDFGRYTFLQRPKYASLFWENRVNFSLALFDTALFKKMNILFE